MGYHKSRKFTVVLENSHYVLDAINQSCPNLVDQKKLINYRRTAVYSSQSWDRIYKKFGNWPTMVGKYLLLPTVPAACFIIFHEIRISLAFISAVFLNGFWGLIVYSSEEFLIGWKTRRLLLNSPSDPLRSLKFVPRYQFIAQVIYLAGLLAICVLSTL